MPTIRYWAAARAAAGVDDEPCEATTLAEALAGAAGRHGERLTALLDVCSYLVDGAPVGGRPRDLVRLAADSVVEVLPPFAGG